MNSTPITSIVSLILSVLVPLAAIAVAWGAAQKGNARTEADVKELRDKYEAGVKELREKYEAMRSELERSRREQGERIGVIERDVALIQGAKQYVRRNTKGAGGGE